MVWFIVIYGIAALIGGLSAKLFKKVKTSSAFLIGISWPLGILLIPFLLVSLFIEAINDAWDDFFGV